MNLADMLPEQAVLPDLAATDSEQVLRELAAPLLALHPHLREQVIVRALLRREQLGSTAVGNGVALPHCNTPDLKRVALAAGRSHAGIMFGPSPKNALCHIFFLILAPEDGTGSHLRVLAQLARRAKEPAFRSALMLSEDRRQMWRIITEP